MSLEQMPKNEAEPEAEESIVELKDSQLEEVAGGTGEGERATFPRENIHKKQQGDS
jgi:hypothetical protein